MLLGLVRGESAHSDLDVCRSTVPRKATALCSDLPEQPQDGLFVLWVVTHPNNSLLSDITYAFMY